MCPHEALCPHRAVRGLFKTRGSASSKPLPAAQTHVIYVCLQFSTCVFSIIFLCVSIVLYYIASPPSPDTPLRPLRTPTRWKRGKGQRQQRRRGPLDQTWPRRALLTTEGVPARRRVKTGRTLRVSGERRTMSKWSCRLHNVCAYACACACVALRQNNFRNASELAMGYGVYVRKVPCRAVGLYSRAHVT